MMESGTESGLIFLAIGLVLIAFVWVLTRWALRMQPSWQAAINESGFEENPEHNDAVVLVHAGGGVNYVNAVARDIFGLSESETPNLERLARRVRPSDTFWKLCASEGQARFSIGGSLFEGSSYQVPGVNPSVLISMRQSELSMGFSGAQDVAGSVVHIITDFGQAIAENLNLEATLVAVLENVEKLVSSDILEIKVLDQERQLFVSYHFGTLEGKEHLVRSTESRFGNYSSYIAEQEESLFVSDTQSYEELRFLEETDQYSIRSYMGFPLLAGGELVGILEVGQIAENVYSAEDQNILQIIVGQAAVAIRNALLYENEQRRAMELSSLAGLAQSTGSLQDREDFFSALIESIKPLFNVSVLGFLLYDVDRRVLEGQVPFDGIPDHIVNIYRTEIGVDSLADEIVKAQKTLIAQDSKSDKNWEGLRIHNIAQAMGLLESALVPLVSSGRFLGYLQLSNHKQGTREFTESEEHLMNVVAKQVATIIDNASFVQQTRQRARRAETMRRVASLVSSSATLEETISFSVRELVQLLGAETAIVFLLDEDQSILNAHKASIYGLSLENVDKFSKLYIDDPRYRYTVTGSLEAFILGDLEEDSHVLEYYLPFMQDLNMQSGLVVPLVLRERGAGEIMLGSSLPDFFTQYDLQATKSVSEHLSVALESSRISEQTDESLRLRVDQLTALSRVSRELNSNLNLEHLLQVVYDEGLKTTKADCGTITIFDQNSVDEGNPESVLALGCANGEILTEAELEVARSGKSLLIEDIVDGEYPANHEGVRSALIAPIAYQGKTVGLFHLHSMSPNKFNAETLELIQTLAIQAAIAMGNASRYEEQIRDGNLLARRAETLSSVLDTTSMLEWDQPLKDSLAVISRGIREATPFDAVLISLYNAKTEMMCAMAGAGFSEDELFDLRKNEQPFVGVQQLLKSEFEIGSAYYIPVETSSGQEVSEEQSIWRSGDLFLFLLKDQYGSPIGLISLDQPSDGKSPDQTTIEAVEVFAAQAGLIISSQSRLGEFEDRVKALSSGLERQQHLLRISQNDLPILLHKDLEQTITIQKLDGVEQRIRAGLKITEAVSRQVDASSALQTLGREIITHMGMMTAFIAENTLDGPRLLHTIGDIPHTINPDALFGQRNPLRSCLKTGEMILVMNLDENDEWRETPLLSALQSKRFIALPVEVNGKTVSAVLATSKEPLASLTDEDEQIYHQITRQASVMFQNIHLLTTVRRRLREVNLLLDFSRTLSNLGPKSMMDILLTNALKVISDAHAGVVLMWNEIAEQLEPQAVMNYADNSSMEKITYRLGEALPGRVFAKNKPLNVDEVDFARDYTLSASQLLLYRQATGGRLPISSLLVPIQTGDYSLGVLVLDNFNKTSAFQREDEVLLISLSQQVALSLQNLRLVQATEERATQLEALTDVTATISSNLQSEELIPSLLSQLESVISYDHSMLWLSENAEIKVVAAHGFMDNNAHVGKSPSSREAVLLNEIFSSRKPLSVSDTREDERFQILDEEEYLSWLGIPLLFKGEVIGVIVLDKKEANFYSLVHSQIGTTFAGQAAVALENAHLFEDSQERAFELNQLTETLEQRVAERTTELEREQRNTKTLLDILTEVSSSLDLDLALRQTLALLNETVGAEQGTVMLLNPDDNLLHYRAGYGYLSGVKSEGKEFTLKVGEGLAGWVVKQRDAILIGDLDRDERWMQRNTDVQRHRSAVAAPLMVGEDVIGVLLVFNRKVDFFSPEQLKLITVIAGQVAVAINNANLYKLIREQAERLGSMLRSEQEEATRSQAILEAVADGVLVTDFENKISFLNASAEHILGIKSEKVTTQTLKDFSGLFGKAANIWHEIIREWSKNPVAYQDGETYAEQLELEDGRIVLVHLAPVMLRGSDFLGTVSIFRDITHEVEVDRMKSEFVATVSHELRTPMTSIRGYVDILLMGAAGSLSDDQTHFLDIIRDNTERLNILVTDLLDVSRLESGKIVLDPQAIALKEIAEDVVANLSHRSDDDEKQMSVSLEIEPDLPPVYGDADRLRQIINNIVENAYHYTPENGKIDIEIYAVNGNNEVQIDVRDNGVGIALEDQTQVFERFYRGEDPLVLATPGTGLGLPIVRQLVEMHRGRIWVESSGKAGEGSLFSFTLPVYREIE